MTYIEGNGYPLIKEEQKIRIALSSIARITIAEDENSSGAAVIPRH